jgi:hypothetical protein
VFRAACDDWRREFGEKNKVFEHFELVLDDVEADDRLVSELEARKGAFLNPALPSRSEEAVNAVGEVGGDARLGCDQLDQGKKVVNVVIFRDAELW